MLALYIFCAILGGGFVLVSALGGALGHGHLDSGADAGGHDVEGAFDHTAETDAPLHGHGASHDAVSAGSFWLPFFSLRFWTYFIGSFGVLGVALNLLKASTEPATMAIAGVTGLCIGWAAAYLIRLLGAPDNNSSIAEGDFLGSVGRVTVAVRGAQPGKVRTSIRGDLIDMIAVSDSGSDVEQGEEVLIVGIERGQARVARKSEYLGE
ncbi:MAG: NfeD family protein [Fimbriimonadaceae bacterium]|nr:NfeD family protein [Fimbriimonadaceae bacterium]QYK56375.1 MAG: NfeD family protein [Fimbriimonadaceae bacterium]